MVIDWKGCQVTKNENNYTINLNANYSFVLPKKTNSVHTKRIYAIINLNLIKKIASISEPKL